MASGYQILPSGKILEWIDSAADSSTGIVRGIIDHKDDLISSLENLNKIPMISATNVKFGNDVLNINVYFNLVKVKQESGENLWGLISTFNIGINAFYVIITIIPTYDEEGSITEYEYILRVKPI